MGFSFSKFAAALTTLLPTVALLVPGGDKIAPYVPTILAGIAEAQKIPGATGAEKKAHVIALVSGAADALAIAKPGKTDKAELIGIASTTIDTVITTIHAIEQAHAALPTLPGIVEQIPTH